MKSSEIRKSFLDFFAGKGHTIVPSAPVIPHGDPTLLFTNAGMNQFKDIFLGKGTRGFKRVADTQKCIRVSGKHNDLEEVGFDTYHHTFFEMLGNWSFGDYYKEEAIQWAWELLTGVWGLPEDRLFATVYKTDDEAYEIWKKYLPIERIQKFDEKDNFWEMGETGPCGPCSEIHFDRTIDKSGSKLVNKGTQDVIEIWNLVFIQYNRLADGRLVQLDAKHVDTGMGFERITAVIQGKNSNYDTDIFSPLINKIEEISERNYYSSNGNDAVAMRVISDHIRTLAFAISDGAMPGNEGRGYVLRRILRRAARFSRNLGIKDPILYKLIPVLVNIMGDYFTELKASEELIIKIVKAEEESFLQTLDNGIEKFNQIINKYSNNRVIPGEEAFLLYDSFGFPIDLTELMARENGFIVDKKGFDNKMLEQKERSRKARKEFINEVDIAGLPYKTNFVGYDELEAESIILYVNKNFVVLDETPFYVESGGQVSDTGTLTIGGEVYQVIDMQKSADAYVHICDRDVEALIGEKALAKVDVARRKDIMRNHSATHLLHEALRKVLGNHVKQAGSLVAPEYLRFDFNHFEKIKPQQIKEIESLVNKKILENVPVQTRIEELNKISGNTNIKMFFGDKYSDIVRVVTMDPSYSNELCGGTHVKTTAEIGLFKIISESSIAAGVRRIEAVTGFGVEKYIRQLEEKLKSNNEIIEELSVKIKKLEKEISKVSSNINDFNEIIKKAQIIEDIRVVIYDVNVDDIDALRNVADGLRNALGTKGVALLISKTNNKIHLACAVTDDLKNEIPAGKLVGESAKIIGGAGGGKPHLATAGGKDLEKLPELVSKFPEIVKNLLN